MQLKSRLGVTLMGWAVGITVIIGLLIGLAFLNRSWMLAFFILISMVLSVCVLITIFARYVDSEKFPLSAYFNIGMTYFYSLMSMGILAVDLGFSLYNRTNQLKEEQESYTVLMEVLWNVIYWGSLVHGSILNKFYQKYWTSGHFSIGTRIKQSIKNLVKLMIMGIVALVVFGLIAYFVIGLNGINGVKAALLIMSNVYSMLVLVILLAYGLFNLPVFLWKYGDNKQSLFTELERAEDIRKQYRTSLVDFHTQVSQCRNLATNHKTEKNQNLMDILLKELPEKDLEGQSIGHSTYFKIELKKDQEVTEDFIANIRYQFMLAFFMYKRKKAKWLTVFNKVESLIEQPVNYSESHIRPMQNQNFENMKLEDLVLKAKPNQVKKLIIYRILAVLSFLFCLLVIITEATVIFDPEQTIVYFIVVKNSQYTFLVVIFTIFFLSGITLVCFFTIFNLKMSDYLQLVPNHTDCITLSSITALCCKIVTVSCFNYMTLIAEIAPGKDADLYSTSYVDFYSSMINVPFFGKYFNTIMPLFIIIFGLLFAALSFLKLKNKALMSFQNISKSKEEKEKESDKKSSGKNADKKPDPNLALKEKIIRGERAILSEIDLNKKREERNKLLKYNVKPQSQIEDEENRKESKKGKKVEAKKIKESVKSSKAATNNKKNGKVDAKSSTIEDASSSINRNSNDSSDSESEEIKLDTDLKAEKKNRFNEMNNLQPDRLNIFKKQKFTDDITEKLLPNNTAKSSSQNNSRKVSQDEFGGGTADDVSRVSSFHSSTSEDGNGGVKSKRNSKRIKKDFKKEGFLMKRKTKTIFGIAQWNKRYAVLDNEQLILYEDHTKKKPRKHIDMSKVKAVNFHYDENAPVKSKKLSKQEKDESRFDLYTPNRTYMFKPEGNSVIESEWWVRILRECARAYNSNFTNSVDA